jgi:hypothetical protein
MSSCDDRQAREGELNVQEVVYCRLLSRQIVCRNSFYQDKVFNEVLGTCIRCRDVVVGLRLTINSLGRLRLRISIFVYATTDVWLGIGT